VPNSEGGIVRSSLRSLARGFLFGVGFGLALFLVYAIALHRLETRAAGPDVVSAEEEFSTKDIALSNVEEQKHDGETYIIGAAKNTGHRRARGVDIQANLFLRDKFVDQYSTGIGELKPGESKYFKITCGCKDSPPAEHDAFKVAVISGY
jgi:hypothetical protein